LGLPPPLHHPTGAVHLQRSCVFQADGVTQFTDNDAGNNGGAVYADEGSEIIAAGTTSFQRNFGKAFGGEKLFFQAGSRRFGLAERRRHRRAAASTAAAYYILLWCCFCRSAPYFLFFFRHFSFFRTSAGVCDAILSARALCCAACMA